MKRTVLTSLLFILIPFCAMALEPKPGCGDIDEEDAVEREVALEELLLKSNEELKALVEARHEADESLVEAKMGHDDMLTTDDITARPYPSLGATLQYDNVNPEASSCKNTAKTVKSVNIYGSDFCNGKYLGTLDLRYSTACRTVWARVRAIANFYAPGDWEGAFCWIHRNSDNKELRYTHRSSDGKTVWTNMLNDKNVTSKAIGGIDSTCGTIEKETGSYR